MQSRWSNSCAFLSCILITGESSSAPTAQAVVRACLYSANMLSPCCLLLALAVLCTWVSIPRANVVQVLVNLHFLLALPPCQGQGSPFAGDWEKTYLNKPTAALCKEQPPEMLKLQCCWWSFAVGLLAAFPLAFGSLWHSQLSILLGSAGVV